MKVLLNDRFIYDMRKVFMMDISTEKFILSTTDLCLVLIGCLFIVLLFSVSIALIQAYIKDKVKKGSLRYLYILDINNAFHFVPVLPVYTYKRKVNSKAKYDRFDFDKCFDEIIEGEYDTMNDRIQAIIVNSRMKEEYLGVIGKAPDYIDKQTARTMKVPLSLARKYEKKIADDATLKPVTIFHCICHVSYCSPQGRNYYEKQKEYSVEELIQHLQSVQSKQLLKESKSYQRKVMTDSLRYDIMKKDGFKCVLCGRTVKDGVKLHVDHIIPIAKGGKTEKNNLRTLCASCNFGKGDKYDANGVN